MMNFLKISEDFAKKEYAKHDPKHQWPHVQEVMKVALYLATFYPQTDLELLKLAVIFHDISYEDYETHVDESIKVARKFLTDHHYPAQKLEKLLLVMRDHSGPHRRKYGEANLIEGKIIYDADKFRVAQTSEGKEKYCERFYL